MAAGRGRLAGISLSAALAAAGGAACHDPAPPPEWARGGAPLSLANARWSFDGDVVEIRENGQVLVDGDVVYVVDRAGRLTDEDHEAVALLMPNGALLGRDAVDLGRIGRTNGAPPGAETAWFTVAPTGRVVLYDADGERSDGGGWVGCSGPVLRTCTLVSHVMLLRTRRRSRGSSGPSIGIGFGVTR